MMQRFSTNRRSQGSREIREVCMKAYHLQFCISTQTAWAQDHWDIGEIHEGFDDSRGSPCGVNFANQTTGHGRISGSYRDDRDEAVLFRTLRIEARPRKLRSLSSFTSFLIVWPCLYPHTSFIFLLEHEINWQSKNLTTSSYILSKLMSLLKSFTVARSPSSCELRHPVQCTSRLPFLHESHHSKPESISPHNSPSQSTLLPYFSQLHPSR